MYYDLPMDHPDRGRAFECECTASLLRERRRKQLREQSGLQGLSRLTFDTFDCREELGEAVSKNLFDAWSAVRTYAETPWPQGWMFLWGGYGSGKTHLAAAAVNHRISVLGQSAMFIVMPDFWDYLRWILKPESEGGFDPYFQRVKKAELLVLDDLGADYPSEWVDETMFQLINYRYNNELPTIITSNVEISSLHERVQSRILDTRFVEKWLIQAPDYRLTDHSALDGGQMAGGNAQPTITQTVRRTRRGKLPAAPRAGETQPPIQLKTEAKRA